ncbi:MAG: hypothetical protein IJ087_18010 [Eggerthellaceae bacterium]|nr:hypothetical protein [Eggerthellaceae bacterium]
MNNYEFDQLRINAKRKVIAVRDEIAAVTRRTVEWATENPDLAMSVIGATIFFTNKAWKIGNAVADTRHQNSKIYDHSLGMYWELRHPLTTNERIAIERRRKSGESYGQILSDMRLLKR